MIGLRMRRLSVAAIVVAFTTTLFTQIASAAPPPQVYSWTGWYGGMNAGGTWSGSHSVNVSSSPLQGFFDGIGPGSYAANAAAGASGNVPVGHKAGFIGGGQIGYNYKFAPAWVAGLEADIQGIVGGKGNGTLNTRAGPFLFALAAEVINTQITASRQLDYLGTVRGRLGYLWAPGLLVYGTGGLAYGRVKANTSIEQSNNDCTQFPISCLATNAATSGSISKARVGWTVGGGLEWMFRQRWSAKVEYLYYDLGSVTFDNGQLVIGHGGYPAAGGPAIIASQSTAKFNGSIVRVGVNYHF